MEETTITAAKNLQVGDCVYTPVLINEMDLVTKGSLANRYMQFSAYTIFSFDENCRTKQGTPVSRIAVVLRLDPKPTMAYLATFRGSTVLPAALDKKYWCPVIPALKEGNLDPIACNNTREPKFHGLIFVAIII